MTISEYAEYVNIDIEAVKGAVKVFTDSGFSIEEIASWSTTKIHKKPRHIQIVNLFECGWYPFMKLLWEIEDKSGVPAGHILADIARVDKLYQIQEEIINGIAWLLGEVINNDRTGH